MNNNELLKFVVDEITFVILEDKIAFKKNGLTIEIPYETLKILQKKLESTSTRIDLELRDMLNGLTGKES